MRRRDLYTLFFVVAQRTGGWSVSGRLSLLPAVSDRSPGGVQALDASSALAGWVRKID